MKRFRSPAIRGGLFYLALSGAALSAEAPPVAQHVVPETAQPDADIDGGESAHGPSGEAAGFCPGGGDCCQAHGNFGCDSASCCNTVCIFQESCCSVGWDTSCVLLARELCGDLCGSGRCPGSFDCCSFNGSAGGCSDETCCTTVCNMRPDCCDDIWDSTCVLLAHTQCGGLCGPVDPCPGTGSCCVTHSGTGCDDEACCELVCGEDGYCCTGEWDGICSGLANLLCVPQCTGTCPADGDCCAAHGGPGCDDTSCCGTVCAQMPECCSVAWDADCVAAAGALCGETCGGTCPSPGKCCSEHATPGCEDAACCEAVCAKDAFCCFLDWNFDCASIARDLCAERCLGPPVCPKPGNCCTDHATAGCDDSACCERVCATSPSCCTGTWTSACADLAAELCGGTCWCATPGALAAPATTDLRDVAAFQRCFDESAFHKICGCGDATGDTDIDLIDWRALLHQLAGPSSP